MIGISSGESTISAIKARKTSINLLSIKYILTITSFDQGSCPVRRARNREYTHKVFERWLTCLVILP